MIPLKLSQQSGVSCIGFSHVTPMTVVHTVEHKVDLRSLWNFLDVSQTLWYDITREDDQKWNREEFCPGVKFPVLETEVTSSKMATGTERCTAITNGAQKIPTLL